MGDVVVGDETTRAGDFLGEVLTGLVGLVRANAEWFAETHEVDALHQLRISVRKTRALGTFMDPLTLGDPVLRGANRRLRELARPFGEVRDLDVLMAAVGEAVAPVVEADRGALRESLGRRRGKAAAEAEALLDSLAWQQELDVLQVAATEGQWRRGPAAEESARYVVVHGLDAWWWTLTERWRDLAHLSDSKRHRLRIAAKKMRYLTELTAGLWEPEVGERREAATAAFKLLQDNLGELQDYVAAVEVIRAHGFRATGADPRSVTAAMAGAVAVRSELEAAGPYWR
nr:CHAD domain-containing protein [Actinomycetales bacterium]